MRIGEFDMIRRFESVSKRAYLSKVATSLQYLYDDINTLKISDFVGFSARIGKGRSLGEVWKTP